MASAEPTNREIADVLERIADLLEAQGANPYRIGAYRSGAASVRAAREPVAALVRAGGGKALRALPSVGEGLARVVAEYVETGRSSLLESLQARVAPEEALATVPGVGEEGAHQIVSEIGITTLEELELAAHDGRLGRLDGFGPDRVITVELSLAGLLSQSARRRMTQRVEAGEGGSRDRPDAEERPSVALLLDIDAEYRTRGEAGELRTIAPRRFNPSGEAWLPVLEKERDGWLFTALYSNTARAHELGTTHDWVVIYYERAGHQHQATVVTAARGPLAGKRVVRGREPESREHYGISARGTRDGGASPSAASHA